MAVSLSIIIPLFNRKELIKETIDSVCGQSNKNFQCIIIDDHSTDDSFEVVKDYIGGDNRFIIEKRNSELKGASVCRNEGIDLATGDFIMFLDSDDLLDPRCVAQRFSLVHQELNRDFYVFQVALFDHNTYVSEYLWSKIDNDDDLEAFINSNGWSISNTLFKRNFLQNNHYFDDKAQSWQDVEFHIRALLKTSNYSKFSQAKPDVYIRVSSYHRVSNSNLSYLRILSRINTYLKIESILVKNGVNYYKDPFLIYYFKYLEIAARTLSLEEYFLLKKQWTISTKISNSSTFMLRSYLDFQSYLTKFKLYYVGSVFYRLVRFFISEDLLYSKNKKIKHNKPIDIKRIMKYQKLD